MTTIWTLYGSITGYISACIVVVYTVSLTKTVNVPLSLTKQLGVYMFHFYSLLCFCDMGGHIVCRLGGICVPGSSLALLGTSAVDDVTMTPHMENQEHPWV